MKKLEELNYKSILGIYETQEAIKYIKDKFEEKLAKNLKLLRVSAPLFVNSNTGLNDGLDGSCKAISFSGNYVGGDIEIVHSLAKWKRMALAKYDVYTHNGIYADMNAIRKDEKVDFIHSIYVDQWDWEIAINKEDRKLSYLKQTVRKIYKAIYQISIDINKKYPSICNNLPKDITFISSKDLLEMYPNLSSKERENEIARKYGAVFIYQIGGKLKNGMPHDARAADYDDWKLNGDILVYYDLYDMALELSSMGIRVDKNSLVKQLTISHQKENLENTYCQDILNDRIPLSIGGGIGQSRLCMLLLKKAHIGEVQVSIWNEQDINTLRKNNIELL